VNVGGQAKPAVAKATAFARADDPLAVSNAGAEPAEVYVTEFTTAATGDPAQRRPTGQALQSTVLNWEEGAAEYGSEASTHKSAFIERRVFLPPSETLTSPRVTIHAQMVDPATAEVHYGGHPDVCLFFMLTGGFEFKVPGVTHRTGPGGFLYLAEEEPHGQVPFDDDVTCYFVVHVWSAVSWANAVASGYL
jgi:hypothetical protein